MTSVLEHLGAEQWEMAMHIEAESKQYADLGSMSELNAGMVW